MIKHLSFCCQFLPFGAIPSKSPAFQSDISLAVTLNELLPGEIYKASLVHFVATGLPNIFKVPVTAIPLFPPPNILPLK